SGPSANEGSKRSIDLVFFTNSDQTTYFTASTRLSQRRRGGESAHAAAIIRKLQLRVPITFDNASRRKVKCELATYQAACKRCHARPSPCGRMAISSKTISPPATRRVRVDPAGAWARE